MLDKFKIGHYTDSVGGTGVTVILAEDGAVGGVCVRGASPATRETELLKSDKLVEKINAVVLSGGSAFGLEAACGVMDYLAEIGKGFKVNQNFVPIVSAASLYDLEYKKFVYPDKAAGYAAAKDAKDNNFKSGAIGVATGATVGKLCGMEYAAKTGFAFETYEMDGIEIAVVIVANALGDIVDNGKIIAGMQGADGRFMDSLKVFGSGGFSPFAYKNTTLGCVLTNAKLTKVEANVLADLAHDGIALAISPSHTRFDGDAIFCMASGEKEVNFDGLSAFIPRLTQKAIIKAARVPTSHVQQRVSSVKFAPLHNVPKE